MNLKDYAEEKIFILYKWLFKKEPGIEAKRFIESIMFVFVATGIAKALLLAMNIVGGRLLGEATYGEYTLVISVASFLAIPFGFGVIGGLIKQLAVESSDSKIRRIISTSINYFAISVIMFVLIYFLLSNQLAAMIKMGPNLFLLSIAIAAITGAYSLLENIMRGLHKQKEWSKFTVMAYSSSFLVFVALIFLGSADVLLMLIPLAVIYIIFSASSYAFIIRHHSLSTFDSSEWKQMFSYGIFVFIITITTTMLGNVDKLMLNYYLSSSSVGIYQAHYFSSIMVIGVLTGIFVSVFFPTAVKLSDIKGLLAKLNTIALISIPFVAIITYIAQIAIIYLYGFNFNYIYAIFFTLATIADVLVVLYASLLMTQSKYGIRFMTISIVACFLVNIILNYILIPKIGIVGAITATAISFILEFLLIAFMLKKISNSQKYSDK